MRQDEKKWMKKVQCRYKGDQDKESFSAPKNIDIGSFLHLNRALMNPCRRGSGDWVVQLTVIAQNGAIF